MLLYLYIYIVLYCMLYIYIYMLYSIANVLLYVIVMYDNVYSIQYGRYSYSVIR